MALDIFKWQCISQWIEHILQTNVTFDELKNGSKLTKLIALLGDSKVRYDTEPIKSFDQFEEFLNGCCQLPVSQLFAIKDVLNGVADEEEFLGLHLLVLIVGLQSATKELFINAALELEDDKQMFIFQLIQEPLNQLNNDQQLNRDIILNGFRQPAPSQQLHQTEYDRSSADPCDLKPLLLEDPRGSESTPIKASSFNTVAIRSDYLDQHGSISKDHMLEWPLEAPRHDVPKPLADSSHYDSFDQHRQGDSTAFRVPETVCPRKARAQRQITSEAPSLMHSTSHNPEDECAKFTRPPPPEVAHLVHDDPPLSITKQQRPTDLLFHPRMTEISHCASSLPPVSITTSLGDLSDWNALPRYSNQSLASPLTSLKHLIDSPLWTQKTRLREVERERRRLVTELEKERNYRDEAENLVAELRSRLDEARSRATDAESKATRLSRELAALQDQTDELNICRSELTLREDEMTNLKKRLNSFQDLLSHAKKLEIQNTNLQQECADHRQKVDQLTAKLSEIKDRRMICAEVETLRSKLEDTEAQLANELLDRENAAKEARRQNELYNQLKLQHVLAEKRRGLNKYQTRVGNSPYPTSDSDGKLNCGRSFGNVSDIEFDGSIILNSQSHDQGLSKIPQINGLEMSNAAISALRSGENLGNVLEIELQSANNHIFRLQNELSEARLRLSNRETQLEQVTERVEHLTADLSALSIQRTLHDESKIDLQNQLNNLQDDMSTLGNRILSLKTYAIECSNTIPDLTDFIDQWQQIGIGLCEPLDNLPQIFVDQFKEILRVQEEQLMVSLTSKDDTIQSLMHEKQTFGELNDKLTKLVEELEENCSSQKSTIRVLECEKKELSNQLNDYSVQYKRLEGKLSELEEKRFCSARDNQEHMCDICTQTNASLAELPLELSGYVLQKSLEHLDGEISPNVPTEDDHRGPSQSAYEALAADRRGLSDELVRLHDELADAVRYAEQMQLENSNLSNKLQEQTILFNRAQENWAIVELKYRENEQKLTDLREEHADNLKTIQMDFLAEIERCRDEAATAIAERNALHNKLSETNCDMDKLQADHNRLVERNTDLQRELNTTRSLVEAVSRNQIHATVDPSLTGVKLRSKDDNRRLSGSVEKWVHAANRENEHRPYSTIGMPDAVSMDGESVVDSLSTDYRSFSKHPTPIEKANRKCGRHSGSVVDEVARLTSRTAVLEAWATALAKQKKENEVSNCKADGDLRHMNSDNRASSTNGHLIGPLYNHLDAERCIPPVDLSCLIRPSPNNNQPISSSMYPSQSKINSNGQDLDTDADSSAFTDLSQVSPISPKNHSNPLRKNDRHSSPIPPDTSRMSNSQSAQQSDPIRPANSEVNKWSDHPYHHERTLSAPIVNRCSILPLQLQTDLSLLDPDRISELHRRNRLQPLHLRTSYPAETQATNPDDVAAALAHLTSTHQQQKSSSSRVFPLSPVSENHGKVLRETAEENVNDQHQTSCLSEVCDSKSSHVTQPSSQHIRPSSAAGYQAIPKDLQAITDALIAASFDPTAMATALTNELSRASLIVPSTSKSAGPHDARKNQSTDLSHIQTPHPLSWGISPGLQESITDENRFPTSNGIQRVSSHKQDVFLRPATPASVRDQPCSKDHAHSDDSLSACSSTRSSQSSIAFEIPFHETHGKPRPVRIPRPPQSSTRTQRTSEYPPPERTNPSTRGKPKVRSTLPSDESFRTNATPVQRNAPVRPGSSRWR